VHDQILQKEVALVRVLYHASDRYSKVCGRVIGYQFGSPSAFERGVIEDRTIDEGYMLKAYTHYLWS
jgi:hypothetical protein